MIAEAIDAAVTLGWALAVWVLLLAALATAALYALVVTVVLACMTVSRGVAAGLAAVQRGAGGEAGAGPQETADARMGPSWARTDTEEAA